MKQWLVEAAGIRLSAGPILTYQRTPEHREDALWRT